MIKVYKRIATASYSICALCVAASLLLVSDRIVAGLSIWWNTSSATDISLTFTGVLAFLSFCVGYGATLFYVNPPSKR